MKEIKKGSINSFMIYSKWKILWLSKTHSRKLLQSSMTTTMTGALSLTAVGKIKAGEESGHSLTSVSLRMLMGVSAVLHVSVYEKHYIKEEISRVAPKCHIEMLLLTDDSVFFSCKGNKMSEHHREGDFAFTAERYARVFPCKYNKPCFPFIRIKS